jgi:hypothetical protein
MPAALPLHSVALFPRCCLLSTLSNLSRKFEDGSERGRKGHQRVEVLRTYRKYGMQETWLERNACERTRTE